MMEVTCIILESPGEGGRLGGMVKSSLVGVLGDTRSNLMLNLWCEKLSMTCCRFVLHCFPKATTTHAQTLYELNIQK